MIRISVWQLNSHFVSVFLGAAGKNGSRYFSLPYFTGCYFFSRSAARWGWCFHLSRHLSLGTIFHPKKAAHAVPLNQYFSSFSPKT
jgi:hypothetical protein